MAMIKFDNVEKYYGKFHALKNINLEFEKGEVVVVIGPSGSGKSTLVNEILYKGLNKKLNNSKAMPVNQ